MAKHWDSFLSYCSWQGASFQLGEEREMSLAVSQTLSHREKMWGGAFPFFENLLHGLLLHSMSSFCLFAGFIKLLQAGVKAWELGGRTSGDSKVQMIPIQDLKGRGLVCRVLMAVQDEFSSGQILYTVIMMRVNE
jgi:hypothetical protein